MRRTTSQELNDLCGRVNAWRNRQGKRTRIPEELWEAAVEVARVDGIWATARATRFNFKKLQQLAGARDRHGSRAMGVASAGPTFVELPLGAMGGSGGGARSVIEMVGRHGDRMRLEVGARLDIVGLVHAFWSRQP